MTRITHVACVTLHAGGGRRPSHVAHVTRVARITHVACVTHVTRWRRQASLVTHHHEKESWTEQANTYEEWAMGTLDAIADPNVAVRILTTLPSKRGVLLWPRSVMDSATGATYRYIPLHTVTYPLGDGIGGRRM